MNRIRLLLLDDHVLFREGLSRLLVTEPDFETVAQCGTPAEALQVLAGAEVDVVLLDYDLENDTGPSFISAAMTAGYRGKILMVTAGMNESQCSLAWRLGVSGIALKHSSPASLLEAIRTVFEGGRWNHQTALGPAPARSTANRAGGLSPREQQVLRGILEGLTNKDIARNIGVSLSSVKGVLQLFDKTGVRTRSQLVRIAIEKALETKHVP
jgi:two-component system, NarL family, nitrate/nitrite response regulator NarL